MTTATMPTTARKTGLVRTGARYAAMLALVGSMGLATGCQNEGSGALAGGAIGALAGLGIGSLTGDAGKGAAAGAIGGAVLGGIIGNQNRERRERENHYYDQY